jgi:hypothetical protein
MILSKSYFIVFEFDAAKLRKKSWSFAAGTEKRCTFAAL